MQKKIIGVCFFILSFMSFSQEKTSLLTDTKIQFECTEAIDSLYNFNFNAAEKQFNWLRQDYPNHPLPYFLMGLSQWWKIMPDLRIEKYDDSFYAYMDSTIAKAELILDKDPEHAEAHFFLAAAYGFLGRFYAERKSYTKAAFAAKNCLEHLDLDGQDEVYSPEFLFGIALYNYYRDWIPAQKDKRYLRPVIGLFRKGDKDLGLKQLERVTTQAFYTRIEGQVYLMDIYFDNEKRKIEAYEIVSYLSDHYPNNAYFITKRAEYASSAGRNKDALIYGEKVIQGIDNKILGYTPESGRIVSYYMGKTYYLRGEKENARIAFERAVKFAKEVGSEYKNYTLYSLEKLAKIAEEKNDVKTALAYCEELLDYADDNNAADEDAVAYAKKYVKEHKEKSWWQVW